MDGNKTDVNSEKTGAGKIYTKKGDKGLTSLLGARRIRKDHERIRTIGSLDELNANVGMTLSFLKEWSGTSRITRVEEFLGRIQSDIFSIGGYLAQLTGDSNLVDNLDTDKLEHEMDFMSETLEPLRNFILPGGNTLTASCHVTRAVVRRAERNLTHLFSLPDTNCPKGNEINKYINRLSDYFFVLGRYLSKLTRVGETIWKSN